MPGEAAVLGPAEDHGALGSVPELLSPASCRADPRLRFGVLVPSRGAASSRRAGSAEAGNHFVAG